MAKKSNFLDFVNAQSKNTHHTTWLTASRNLHSNTHSHLTTRTHGLRLFVTQNVTKHGSWKVETFRLPKIWKPTSPTWTKSITKLPFQARLLLNKQTIAFPFHPPPPPQLNVVCWVTDSFLASITSHINIA